jgi:hypothetical protein
MGQMFKLRKLVLLVALAKSITPSTAPLVRFQVLTSATAKITTTPAD